jgi:hypothetical protein
VILTLTFTDYSYPSILQWIFFPMFSDVTLLVWSVVGWCRESLPSQARELACDSWLICQPKPVYKAGFIREKRKATAGEVQRSPPETSNSLLRWRLGFLWTFNSGLGGFFSLAVDSRAFSGKLVCLPLMGKGKQSWEHFAHQPCGRSIRPCISSSGCRTTGL